MRIAVLFDAPAPGWSHLDHAARMEVECAPGYGAEAEPEYQVAWALQKKGHEVFLVGPHDDPTYATDFLADHPVDLVFNLCEGFNGKDNLDYLLPALIEAEGVAYTGAPPQGLMVTRNKGLQKKILSHHGVLAPRFLTFRVGEKPGKDIELNFPAIVKPLRSDASVGISRASIVHNAQQLAERVKFVHERFSDAAICEEYIEGRELYVSVMGNGKKLTVLPIIELAFDKDSKAPEDRISTQLAKWSDEYCERKGIRSVFARPLSRVATARIEEACKKAFRALWLRDYARFDIRLDENDRVWILEGNANPYICEGHEIASSYQKLGNSYPDFVERIVKIAVKRARKAGYARVA